MEEEEKGKYKQRRERERKNSEEHESQWNKSVPGLVSLTRGGGSTCLDPGFPGKKK